MTEEEYMELINREIDEDITPEDRQRLLSYLSSDPDAQARRNEITRLARVLKHIEDVDPPSDLKNNIMSTIRNVRHPEKGSESLLQSLVSALVVKRSYRYAYAFSAGLAAGLALFALYVGPGRDASFSSGAGMSGTIADSESPDRSYSGGRIDFDMGDSRGFIESRIDSAVVIAQVEVVSSTEVGLTIIYDSEDLSFEGFEQQSSSPVSVRLQADKISLTHSGFNKYGIHFRDDTEMTSQLNISILAEDSVLSKTLSTSR